MAHTTTVHGHIHMFPNIRRLQLTTVGQPRLTITATIGTTLALLVATRELRGMLPTSLHILRTERRSRPTMLNSMVKDTNMSTGLLTELIVAVVSAANPLRITTCLIQVTMFRQWLVETIQKKGQALKSCDLPSPECVFLKYILPPFRHLAPVTRVSAVSPMLSA